MNKNTQKKKYKFQKPSPKCEKQSSWVKSAPKSIGTISKKARAPSWVRNVRSVENLLKKDYKALAPRATYMNTDSSSNNSKNNAVSINNQTNDIQSLYAKTQTDLKRSRIESSHAVNAIQVLESKNATLQISLQHSRQQYRLLYADHQKMVKQYENLQMQMQMQMQMQKKKQQSEHEEKSKTSTSTSTSTSTKEDQQKIKLLEEKQNRILMKNKRVRKSLESVISDAALPSHLRQKLVLLIPNLLVPRDSISPSTRTTETIRHELQRRETQPLKKTKSTIKHRHSIQSRVDSKNLILPAKPESKSKSKKQLQQLQQLQRYKVKSKSPSPSPSPKLSTTSPLLGASAKKQNKLEPKRRISNSIDTSSQIQRARMNLKKYGIGSNMKPFKPKPKPKPKPNSNIYNLSVPGKSNRTRSRSPSPSPSPNTNFSLNENSPSPTPTPTPKSRKSLSGLADISRRISFTTRKAKHASSSSETSKLSSFSKIIQEETKSKSKSKSKSNSNGMKLIPLSDDDQSESESGTKIWTLDDLVVEVTSDTNAVDRTRNALLLCHVSFATSLKLFRSLRKHFRTANTDLLMLDYGDEHLRKWALRVRITNCIKYWMKEYWQEDFHHQLEIQQEIGYFHSDITSTIQDEKYARCLIQPIVVTLRTTIQNYGDDDACLRNLVNDMAKRKTTPIRPDLDAAKKLSDVLMGCRSRSFSISQVESSKTKQLKNRSRNSVSCSNSSSSSNSSGKTTNKFNSSPSPSATPTSCDLRWPHLRSSTNRWPDLHLMQMDSEDIAQQITLLDFYVFKHLKRRELIQQRWKKKKTKNELAPNVLRMIAQFNSVSKWVQITILTATTVKQRRKYIKKMIQIAKYLQIYGNLSSLTAFYNALISPNIEQLQVCWSKVNRKSKEVLNGIGRLYGWKMTNLRLLQEEATPPFVPHLGITLQTLFQIDEGHKDFLSNESINYVKMMLMSEQIAECLLLQCGEYDFEAKDLIQQYLVYEWKTQEPLSENHLYKLAKTIKKLETM